MTADDELNQRVRQIDGWIRALTSEVHFLDERVHLVKPLVQDSQVQAAMQAKLHGTLGAELWNQLVPLLGQDYIRELARLFLDKGDKTGSLTNIWRKLNVSGVRERYRISYGHMDDYRYDRPMDGFSQKAKEEWRQQDRQKNLAHFDEEWSSLSRMMEKLVNGPVGNSIRTFRDKRHAHWEMQPLAYDPEPFDISTLGLTYAVIFAFGQECEQILADLGKLLTHTHWEPSEFSEMSAEQGKALWMTLAN
ncbi:hypothetical protein ABQF04_15630 [Xanthomonas campestris pv. campestris]|uniref:AbiU2 domain-containing protein n=1 Tax=Xanthomonas TaxID=338 RepID=UPI002DD688CF|nr:hypothetical protein [Xanthomonas arboricola]NIK30944.1 hypothetical protein [Xanthomonas arboricola]